VSKYLAALKGQIFEKPTTRELPKLPKAPYGSYDSDQVTGAQKYRRPNEPGYRWLVVWPNGGCREICTLPEMTAAELTPCYPGADFLPLPDAAAEASATLS